MKYKKFSRQELLIKYGYQEGLARLLSSAIERAVSNVLDSQRVNGIEEIVHSTILENAKMYLYLDIDTVATSCGLYRLTASCQQVTSSLLTSYGKSDLLQLDICWC